MKLMICTDCGEHYLREKSICPHCNHKGKNRRLEVSMAILMGVSLTGCPLMPVESKYGMPPIDSGFIDNDMDGATYMDDCDDNNPLAFPGAAELDSETDCMLDADDDGYGEMTPENSAISAGTDCEDSNAEVNPGATEIEGDGVDSNCDGNDDQ
jgi:hypothetical protein